MGETVSYPLGIHALLGLAHITRLLPHHVRHPVHGIIRLDLRDRELGHVGGLVHLLCDCLFCEEHPCLLVCLLCLALFEKLYTVPVSIVPRSVESVDDVY